MERWSSGDWCSRLSSIRTGREVKIGRRVRRKREWFSAIITGIVVVITSVVVSSGGELEWRGCTCLIGHAASI